MDCEQSQLSFSDPPGHCIFRLSGALGVADAEAMCRAAKEICERPQDTVVDWNGVSQVDVSIAQVLLALRVALQEQGKCLSNIGTPPSIQAWLGTAGLYAFLGPQVETK
jgi:anti-anti-sigma regulatory factor